MNKPLTITGGILLGISIMLILSASVLAWFPHGPFDRDLTNQEKIYTLHGSSAYTLGLKGVVRGCLTGTVCDFEVQFYNWNTGTYETVFTGTVKDDETKHYSADINPFTRVYDEDGMYDGYVRTFSDLHGLADYNDIDVEVCDPQLINENNDGLYPELSPNTHYSSICRRFIIKEYSNKICEYGRIGSYEKWTAQQGRYAEIANTCYRYDAQCFKNTAIDSSYGDYYECAGKAVDLNNNKFVNSEKQVKYKLVKDDYGVAGYQSGNNFFEIRTLAETNPINAYNTKLAEYNRYLIDRGEPTVNELYVLYDRSGYQQPQYSLISNVEEFDIGNYGDSSEWFVQNQIYLYTAMLFLSMTLLSIGLVGGKK